MKLRWDRLGGQMGVIVCVAGFLMIFLGWNGAASHGSVVEQFPYLVSGGVTGLALVIVGAALIVVQSQRVERAELQHTINELRETVDRLAMTRAAAGNGAGGADLLAQAENAGLVIAGPSSYHRPDCRLVQGRTGLPAVPVAEAQARGLSPCRTCDAAMAEADLTPGRRRRAARR